MSHTHCISLGCEKHQGVTILYLSVSYTIFYIYIYMYILNIYIFYVSILHIFCICKMHKCLHVKGKDENQHFQRRWILTQDELEPSVSDDFGHSWSHAAPPLPFCGAFIAHCSQWLTQSFPFSLKSLPSHSLYFPQRRDKRPPIL